MDKYEVFYINKEQKESLEQLGTKEKFWFKDDSIKNLFKVGRPNTGENWVEVVVADICMILDLPHAKYLFAEYENLEGTITSSFVPDGGRLVHGNELLAKAFERIEIEYEEHRFYKVRNYNLRVIQAILSHSAFQPAFDVIEYDIFETAFDMFIGYIILDCLISNQDRHHENWGVIIMGELRFLAPTFDHASGLGSKEHDEKKSKRLSGSDPRVTMKHFVERAKTPFYHQGKILTTYEAVEACAKLNPKFTLYWLEKIDNINLDKIKEIFDKIPDTLISPISIEFAIEMIKENKNRLLEIKRELESE